MKSFEKNEPWEEKKKKIIEDLIEEGEEYKKESIQKWDKIKKKQEKNTVFQF